MSTTNTLPLHTAAHLLAKAIVDVLADYAFGDREATWKLDGQVIAGGYFGNTNSVSFTKEALAKLGFETGSFTGDEAYSLKYLGKTGMFERNDTTNPYED